MSNKSKRQTKLFRKVTERIKREHVDSVSLFFALLNTKEKYSPQSREKIRLDPCSYCGTNDHTERTVDHVVPKSEGGSNAFANLVSSCSRCNNAKGSMSLLHYLLSRV